MPGQLPRQAQPPSPGASPWLSSSPAHVPSGTWPNLSGTPTEPSGDSVRWLTPQSAQPGTSWGLCLGAAPPDPDRGCHWAGPLTDEWVPSHPHILARCGLVKAC